MLKSSSGIPAFDSCLVSRVMSVSNETTSRSRSAMKARHILSAILIFSICNGVAVGAKSKDIDDVILGPAAISKSDETNIKSVLSDPTRGQHLVKLRNLRARKSKLGVYVCGDANAENLGFKPFIVFRLASSDRFTLLNIGNGDQTDGEVESACASMGM
jgi:hypothetical protein